MTKIIGLTGGIGSGKTTVANIFREHGIPIYIADSVAKTITEKPQVIAEISKIFGADILENDKIDRTKLASIVFNDAEKLQLLNNIIHPAVRKDFLEWTTAHNDFPFVLKETAILFESENDRDCDIIITVTAPIELRIQRVLSRDKTTRENIIRRIDNQWTDEMRISKSDYVIDNVGLIETQGQVEEILKKLHII